MSDESNENQFSVTAKRRTVVKGAAWSIPVIAAVVAAPAAAASGNNDGGFTTCGGPWKDNRDTDGYIVECIVFTLKDSKGNPVSGENVQFFITSDTGPFFLVDDSEYDENTAVQLRDNQQRTRTLTTDSNGRIELNGAGTNNFQYGWIRKGQSSETTSTLYARDPNDGSTLGVLTLSLGGKDEGIKPGR